MNTNLYLITLDNPQVSKSLPWTHPRVAWRSLKWSSAGSAFHHLFTLLTMPYLFLWALPTFSPWAQGWTMWPGAEPSSVSHSLGYSDWFRDRHKDPFRTNKTLWEIKEGPFLFPANVKWAGWSHGGEQLAVAILGTQKRVFVRMDSAQNKQSPDMKRETRSWTQHLSPEGLSSLSLDHLASKPCKPV